MGFGACGMRLWLELEGHPVLRGSGYMAKQTIGWIFSFSVLGAALVRGAGADGLAGLVEARLPGTDSVQRILDLTIFGRGFGDAGFGGAFLLVEELLGDLEVGGSDQLGASRRSG